MSCPDPTPYPLDHLAQRGAPSDLALRDRAGELSYAALDQAVGGLAAGLLAKDCQPGDCVASWLNKTRLACLLPLACARAGLIHVPLNPLLKRAQVAHILTDSSARLLVTGATRAATLLADDLPAACQLLDDQAEITGPYLPPSNHHPNNLAAILYTSGSTGKPKGVMLSHANLWLGAISVAHYLDLHKSDRTLALLPLAFDYGQNQLLASWAAGAAVIPLDYLFAQDVIKAVASYDITVLAGVPPLWTQLLEVAWPDPVAARLKTITNSGGRLAEAQIRLMRTLFPSARLHSMYGLTEAFRSTSLDPELIAQYPTSIGRAIPFAEILIVDQHGQAASSGELVHAGPLVAQGYWQDAERTAARFKPAPAHASAGGLAVWSGDQVRSDAQGLLYFVGRDDDLIKVSGNRISPTELEEAAIAGGATEAVAFGVPDERLGQAIILLIRGDTAMVSDYLRRELPNFMFPREIITLDLLPRTPNGKLDRVALKQRYGQ
jgi:acyl-CoA ligase (AMP-forming) (exosortase A-associated)